MTRSKIRVRIGVTEIGLNSAGCARDSGRRCSLFADTSRTVYNAGLFT